MEGIYNDTPEMNLVSRVNSVSAVLYLQFVLHVMLFRMSNVQYSTIVLSEICVQCPIWLFFL
jgi:hypothetical protein